MTEPNTSAVRPTLELLSALRELAGHLEAFTFETQHRLGKVEEGLKSPACYFHNPIDYEMETHAPVFAPSVVVPGEEFPLPPPTMRPGYAPDDDTLYLQWGKSDHDVIARLVKKHLGMRRDMTILDWGCSSGRVLRHFEEEHREFGWNLVGIDIQDHLVEWLRRHFPSHIRVLGGSMFPHLPFRDSSIDIIYGISVFTHTKYLWDMWLEEFRRVLKPGGLCLQTVQCEPAWRHYHANREVDWVKAGHPASMLAKPEIDEDFFFYGNGAVSQTFWREKTLRAYWSRIMEVVDVLPPPEFSYQNWVVLRNDE